MTRVMRKRVMQINDHNPICNIISILTSWQRRSNINAKARLCVVSHRPAVRIFWCFECFKNLTHIFNCRCVFLAPLVLLRFGFVQIFTLVITLHFSEKVQDLVVGPVVSLELFRLVFFPPDCFWVDIH